MLNECLPQDSAEAHSLRTGSACKSAPQVARRRRLPAMRQLHTEYPGMSVVFPGMMLVRSPVARLSQSACRRLPQKLTVLR